MSEPGAPPSAGQPRPKRKAQARAPARRATSRRATPRRATSSSPPRARAASASRRTSTRCPAATARCWRWTSPATARRTPKSLLVVSSACHGVEGFCGSGVQVALLDDAGGSTTPPRRPASPCSTSTASIRYGFSWWRRTTHENVDLNRNFRDFDADAPTNDALRRTRRAARARRAGRPTRRRPPRSTRFVDEHGDRALQQAVSGGQYAHPDGLFYGGAAPTWSHATLRQVLRDHGTRCARLGWIDLHTGLGPNGHGERIFACRDDAAAYARAKAWWGDVTSIYDGSSTSAVLTGLMWTRGLRGMPAGRIHRHRPRVRHPAAARGDARAARRPVAREPSRGRRRNAAHDQAADCATPSTPTPTRGRSKIVAQGVDAAHGALRGLGND